jgi:hypothetical protein
VHLRRALLLFAIVLGLTAIASSVAPPPREATRNGGPPATTETPPPQPRPPAPMQTLAFRYPPPARARAATVERRAHLVVTVRPSTPGQATIPRLGLTGSAEPDTPASFDVLLDDPGRYDVIFHPSAGAPSRVGTVVVRE